MKTKRVWLVIVGHAAANLMAILRAETGWLDFAYEPDLEGIVFSILMMLFGILLTSLCIRTNVKIKIS